MINQLSTISFLILIVPVVYLFVMKNVPFEACFQSDNVCKLQDISFAHQEPPFDCQVLGVSPSNPGNILKVSCMYDSTKSCLETVLSNYFVKDMSSHLIFTPFPTALINLGQNPITNHFNPFFNLLIYLG